MFYPFGCCSRGYQVRILHHKQTAMSRYITNYENLSLWQISEEELSELSKFVIEENYKHHQPQMSSDRNFEAEFLSVLKEEKAFYHYSSIIVAKDEYHNMVGAIRVTSWDNNPHTIPLSRLFGNQLVDIPQLMSKHKHVWHIGRFAIKKGVSDNGRLFKLLMLYAISPIFRHTNGVILAEADERLLRVMQAMRIKATPLAAGKEYIGSVTLPILIPKEGLNEFLLNNVSIAFNIQFNYETELLPERVKKQRQTLNYPFGYCQKVNMYGTLHV